MPTAKQPRRLKHAAVPRTFLMRTRRITADSPAGGSRLSVREPGLVRQTQADRPVANSISGSEWALAWSEEAAETPRAVAAPAAASSVEAESAS